MVQATLETTDVALVKQLLAGETVPATIASASLKAALAAWLRNPEVAAQGLGFKRHHDSY